MKNPVIGIKMGEQKNIILSKRVILKFYLYSFYYHFLLKGNRFEHMKSLHDIDPIKSSFLYSDHQKQIIKEVTTIIMKVEKNAPWSPKCYNLAMLARKMLVIYDVPSKLRIGFRNRNNEIEGHAWVVCNRSVVSGYKADLASYNQLKPIKN